MCICRLDPSQSTKQAATLHITLQLKGKYCAGKNKLNRSGQFQSATQRL